MTELPLTYHYPKVEKPSEAICRAIRGFVVAVMLDAKQPMHVNHIRDAVKRRLRQLDESYDTEIRWAGHNKIERRVNECADPRLWQDGPPPLVHLGDPRSPVYGLNPQRFPEVAE